uniref:Uncharacterized protein n=1 Tax=Pristionchus pacificus TaxID=54126 RepID=A0A2A6BNC3_PRIPA|eukprot:PDM67261.1 hypothetical protein PRIPAC_48678 [Pristionchus pacificus]
MTAAAPFPSVSLRYSCDGSGPTVGMDCCCLKEDYAALGMRKRGSEMFRLWFEELKPLRVISKGLACQGLSTREQFQKIALRTISVGFRIPEWTE